MDAARFDALAHALNAASSRRGVRRALVGLTLAGMIGPLPGFGEVEAKKRKKRKKQRKHQPTPPPDVCQAMADGALCGNDGCLVCLSGVCSPNPQNDESCGVSGDGRCYFGACNPKPTCTGTEAMCPAGDASCCSGRCGGGGCVLAAAGAQCKRGEDCNSGSCIGYRCQ